MSLATTTEEKRLFLRCHRLADVALLVWLCANTNTGLIVSHICLKMPQTHSLTQQSFPLTGFLVLWLNLTRSGRCRAATEDIGCYPSPLPVFDSHNQEAEQPGSDAARSQSERSHPLRSSSGVREEAVPHCWRKVWTRLRNASFPSILLLEDNNKEGEMPPAVVFSVFQQQETRRDNKTCNIYTEWHLFCISWPLNGQVHINIL